MITATDPIVAITVPDSVDLTEKQEIFVAFKQNGKNETSITKFLSSGGITIIDAHHMHVELTQAETLQFSPNRQLTIQANWINPDGKREATKSAFMWVDENLVPRVINVEESV